ncbi:hypothetical protein EYF80_067449 [Liparis tanakae]|uniref:Uncharacterized protein n=1 Tax=Liparis tanakae TaxID=230148 RepID=A0A4Z2E147_9TELE|nr:hypothetical protein EYF80_067449 [Liparis tanakae]
MLAASPLHWTHKRHKRGQGHEVKGEKEMRRKVCLTQQKGSVGRRGGSVQGGRSQGHKVTRSQGDKERRRGGVEETPPHLERAQV